MNPTIDGRTAAGFDSLQDAFARNFAESDEIGAHCCVIKDGIIVANLWGGHLDKARSRPRLADSPQLMFSVGKAVTATCILQTVEKGLLDLDRPIADYWPEFAAAGKSKITTRMVLSHRAGLPVIDAPLSLAQVFAREPVVEAIAAQAPVWEPDTRHGYHIRAFGWILGELMRRVTGISLGDYVQAEIAGPLDIQLWIGLPDAVLPRISAIVPPDEVPDMGSLLGADALATRAMSGPSGLFSYSEMWNDPALLKAEMPSSNAVSDAHSMAVFYAALSGQPGYAPLLQPASLDAAVQVHSEGPDAVIMVESRFGLGYALSPFTAPGAGPGAFGHNGAGGSVCFADRDKGISFAYLTNRMHMAMAPDPRPTRLINALYALL